MSRRLHKTGECIYCGKIIKLTIDHIPPQNLFAEPKKINFIKVPSCNECHGQNPQVSRNDEYFRLMLAVREDINHPDIEQLQPRVMRSLTRPEGKGLKTSLLKVMKDVDARTPSGLFLGRKTAYEVDIARLGNVITRITKGLFWNETGHRLPDEYDLIAFPEVIQNITDDFRRYLNTKFIRPLMSVAPKIIGNKVFAYSVFYTAQDVNISAWLFVFYVRVAFLCLTLPKEMYPTSNP